MKSLTLTVGALSIAFASATAGAQKCDIEDGKPFQLNSAKIYLNQASSEKGKADERPRHLRSAIKVLTENGDRIGNPVGRAYMLGRVLYRWSELPGVGYNSTRGELGYADRPNEPVDLLVAMDSAFSVVEAGAPACADSISMFRRKVGVDLVNASINYLNASKLDSAELAVRRANTIMPDNPYVFNTYAILAERRGQQDSLVYFYERVLATTGSDTTYARMRGQALFNLGVARLNAGERADGAEKTRLLTESRRLLDEYLKMNPGNPNATRALARVAVGLGDTATATTVYAGMLADPSKYNEVQLFEAASALAIAKKNEDAVKLFDAILASNPYYRDALYNLASTHYQAENFAAMLPIARRLVAVDPGNPDSWQQLAAAYQGLRNEEKSDARRKALLDSLVKYSQKARSAPMRVAFSQFRHAGAKHTLMGRVENLGTSPQTVTLKFEFVDRNGNVVATQDATVGPVAAKGQAPFTVEVSQEGIVAFRYAPPF